MFLDAMATVRLWSRHTKTFQLSYTQILDCARAYQRKTSGHFDLEDETKHTSTLLVGGLEPRDNQGGAQWEYIAKKKKKQDNGKFFQSVGEALTFDYCTLYGGDW